MSDGPQDTGAPPITPAPTPEPAPLPAPAPTPQPAAAPVSATPAIDALLKEGSLFDQLAAAHIEAKDNVEGKLQFGITRDMLADFNARASASPDELALVSKDLAKQILFERVWRPLEGDKLPPPVASMLFDIAVRRGVDEAGKLLQKSIGNASRMKLKVDGYLGKDTLEAVSKVNPRELAAHVFGRRNSLIGRIGDGKLFGHDVDFGRAVMFAGEALKVAKILGPLI